MSKKSIRMRVPEGVDFLTAKMFQSLTAEDKETVESTNKYYNKKIIIDGITFDSLLEANYYSNLQFKLAAKEIRGFQVKVKYLLLERVIGKDGRILFPARHYIADFVVANKDGSIEVIDTKGVLTAMYKLKKHLLYIKHKILIKEVWKTTGVK